MQHAYLLDPQQFGADGQELWPVAAILRELMQQKFSLDKAYFVDGAHK